jgi:choline dehydrogenase-like flavoprotein
MMWLVHYDVLIVGAGFAGAEAAYALANKGLRVGLLTTSLDSVYLPFTPIRAPSLRAHCWQRWGRTA